ncbi:MAG: SEC-C metal-binding domain-containing protein [Bryobacteraceae bacterium]
MPEPATRQIPTNPAQFPDLTAAQIRAVQALAAGATVAAAAEAAEVHRDTIYEWRRTKPAFAQAVIQAKSACESQLHDQLAALAQTAIATLRRLLEDPATPPAVQLRAALAVLRRSHFEHKDWNIPVPAEALSDSHSQPTMREVEGALQRLVDDTNEFDRLRKETGEATPRNGPCPCGSGRKYKRCHGQDAPPVLYPDTRQAATSRPA